MDGGQKDKGQGEERREREAKKKNRRNDETSFCFKFDFVFGKVQRMKTKERKHTKKESKLEKTTYTTLHACIHETKKLTTYNGINPT